MPSLNHKLQNLLLQSGMNEPEILIYLELLKFSAENSWQLVERTGLSKSTVYRTVEKLLAKKIIKKDEKEISALSLKTFVADLITSELKYRKLAYKIRQISPFLKTPHDNIEEMEQFFTIEQVKEAYLFMSEQDYQTNLDFGDFENFIPKIGGMETALKFRNNRVKHANHKAICTTFGPYSAYFCTKESEQKYKNKVQYLNSNFKNRFIIFSAENDYVLFNDIQDEENIASLLVKSRIVADMQRSQFKTFSQIVGK